MRRAVLVLLIAVLGLSAGLSLAACGDDTKVVTDTGKNGQTTVKTVADVKFAKTQFVVHMGLAYGAFSRYIKNPYQRGDFKQGAEKRKRTIAKAAIAAVFTYSELKRARRAAESSDTLRRKLLNPIDGLLTKLDDAVAELKAGKLPDFAALLAGFTGLRELAKKSGIEFDEKNVPIPGL